MMTADALLRRYLAHQWRVVPVYRPNSDTDGCSCDKPGCPKPGKHPVEQFWPAGSTTLRAFVGRNVGVKLGPDSQNLADVDLDCREAIVVGPFLLPPTECAFGRDGQVTHALYTVTNGAATFAKLQDPSCPATRQRSLNSSGQSVMRAKNASNTFRQ